MGWAEENEVEKGLVGTTETLDRGSHKESDGTGEEIWDLERLK